MRLTTVILIASLMQVSAAGFAQKVSITLKNASLKTAIKQLKSQTGLDFVYGESLLAKAEPVTINVKGVEINEVLKEVFADQPLTFSIENKTVIISKKEASFIENIIARFQSIGIKGRIVNEQNQGMLGATITVKNKNQIVKTDAQGNFFLSNVDENATLVISFVGYKSMEVLAKKDLGILILKLEDKSLEQVQIIAYGTVKKRFLTSNVGSISEDEIAKQPVQNPLLALQGRVPGLFIQQQSGNSAANVEVVMQGKNSIQKGYDPFYVIDGVPYSPRDIPSIVRGGGVFPSISGSALSFINPADIESVEFLKDADATAIYGSRAANGAILITTKRGKAGETKVNLDIQNGWGKVARKTDLLNTEEYVALRKEAFKNGGNDPADYDYSINGIWDQSRYTDWQKEFIGGTALFQNINATVSGGSDGTQFLIGATYNRETTVYPGDFSNLKGNVHFNLNHASKNKRFQVGLSGNYMQGTYKTANTDLTYNAVNLAPNAPSLRNSDGTLNFEPLATNPDFYTFENPLAQLDNKYRQNTNNLISSSRISYELINGLVLKADLGYNRLENEETSIAPLSAIFPNDRPFLTRTAIYGNKYTQSWIAEPQLTYNKEFSFGHIDGLLGTTFQQSKSNLSAIQGSGYSTDAQLYNSQSAATITVVGSDQSVYRYSAIFARLNYRYKDKYIFNLSARRDGSSRFGSENLFNNFYSIGTAWLFGDEAFVQSALPFLSFGKLRLTYGTTGNEQIGDYGFLNLYRNYTVDIPYQQIVGLTASRLQNPFLQWEETRKANIGLDLGFVDNRIMFSGNYYHNRSSNQLLTSALPLITGFGNVVKNLPATVENSGWEFTLDVMPVKQKNFSWQASANLTIPQNKVVRFDNLETSTYANSIVIGQPANIFKGYKYAGINPETGYYQFRTAKGELTATPDNLTDKIAIVNTNPKWYGGFSNSLTYKKLNFSFLFQGVKQTGTYDRFGNIPGTGGANQPKIVLNRWHSPGDTGALIQKVSSDISEIFDISEYAKQSDAIFTDVFYVRLKNVSLSYTLPESLLSKVHVSNARVYLNGQNLLTISDYNGDPESRLPGSLSPLRVYSLGLQLTF